MMTSFSSGPRVREAPHFGDGGQGLEQGPVAQRGRDHRRARRQAHR